MSYFKECKIQRIDSCKKNELKKMNEEFYFHLLYSHNSGKKKSFYGISKKNLSQLFFRLIKWDQGKIDYTLKFSNFRLFCEKAEFVT